jgi:ABC-type sugar transport system substrate-binding protein
MIRRENKSVNLSVFSPTKSYADMREFYEIVNDLVYNHDFDAIILPFSFCRDEYECHFDEYEDNFINALHRYDGGIVAINVPATREAIDKINYIGYVGGNERITGKILADQILSKKPDIKTVYILNHKANHYGLKLRIQGVKNRLHGLYEEICIDPEKNGKDISDIISEIKRDNRIHNLENNFGIITLGVRGTEMAMEIKKEMGIDFPIVGMDINDKVRDAIKDGVVAYTIIQQPAPYSQGWQAMAMAYNYLKDEMVKPKIISMDNWNEKI